MSDKVDKLPDNILDKEAKSFISLEQLSQNNNEDEVVNFYCIKLDLYNLFKLDEEMEKICRNRRKA